MQSEAQSPRGGGRAAPPVDDGTPPSEQPTAEPQRALSDFLAKCSAKPQPTPDRSRVLTHDELDALWYFCTILLVC